MRTVRQRPKVHAIICDLGPGRGHLLELFAAPAKEPQLKVVLQDGLPNRRQNPLGLAEDTLDGGARRLHQYHKSHGLLEVDERADLVQEPRPPPLPDPASFLSRIVMPVTEPLHPSRSRRRRLLLPVSLPRGGGSHFPPFSCRFRPAQLVIVLRSHIHFVWVDGGGLRAPIRNTWASDPRISHTFCMGICSTLGAQKFHFPPR